MKLPLPWTFMLHTCLMQFAYEIKENKKRKFLAELLICLLAWKISKTEFNKLFFSASFMSS